MNTAYPIVRLKNAWRSSHPWIFQKLVEKPTVRPKPGSIVDVVGVDGVWIGRGFYNGHSRIALRMLENDPDVEVDAGWFARKIGEAVRLRREFLKLDDVSNAWRVVHSEGDGLSGLVVDRYGDLLVVEYFSAGMFRYREWIYDALRAQFPGCRFHAFADEHVQKQESFDFRGSEPAAPAIITEYGVKFRADPAGAQAPQAPGSTGSLRLPRLRRDQPLACWVTTGTKPPKIMRLPSKGIGLFGSIRGSSIIFCMPASRVALSGHSIHENTTDSSSLASTAR